MQELMVVAGSREIRNDDLVFVGMRLPLLAFQLAKETHAPRAIGIFENGILRDRPAEDVLYTMGDNPNLEGATWATSMLDIMSLLQNEKVSLGFMVELKWTASEISIRPILAERRISRSAFLGAVEEAISLLFPNGSSSS
jgi:hypothetical protein